MKRLVCWSLVGILVIAGMGGIFWLKQMAGIPANLFVKASGVTTMTFNGTLPHVGEMWSPSFASTDWWTTCVLDDTGDEVYDWLEAGFKTGLADKWAISRGVAGWDISGLPEDAEITGAYIQASFARISNYSATIPSFRYYQTAKTDNTTVNVNDYNNAYDAGSVALTDWFSGETVDVGGTVITEYILSERLDDFLTPDENDFVWVTFAGVNDMTGYAPTHQVGKYYRIQCATPANVKLVIEYNQDTPDRVVVYPSNAATDNTTDGTEVADNITWGSLRLGYGDEAIYLIVNGDSGASISLELIDGTGEVVAAVDNSVRVDGNYDFVTDLPDDWFGYLRLVESNHNISSSWGYRMPVPDGNQMGNTVYAISPEHPQYNYEFSRYVKQPNTVLSYHWKTNVQGDELDTHSFELWSNADNVTPYYSETLGWLTDNYYYGSGDNAFMSGWRYILMTPDITGSGFENYDGLIINLDKTYSYATSGFLQGVVIDDDDDSVLADTHSSYWYLPGVADGLIMSMAKTDFQTLENMLVTVNVGSVCKVSSYLPHLKLDVYDSEGSFVVGTGGTVTSGANSFDLLAPTRKGDFELRFTFSGDGTWSYIHDIPFVVSVTGGIATVVPETMTGIGKGINETMETFGLGNTVGRWIVILVLSVALFLLFHKSETMRVVGPLLVIAIAMVMGWVETWIVILLALGAGITLWQLFRKKAVGGA